jgi:hypothetical protein
MTKKSKMVETPKIVDQTEEESNFDITQQKTHQYIYMSVSKLFETLSFDYKQGEVAELVMNSLAVNLGTLVGQVSDEYRDEIMESCKKIMNTSCLATVKQLTASQYGQIGHA